MADERDEAGNLLYTPERFPIVYPGSAQFIGGDGQPSGARGAIAHIQITLNNLPHEITGFRIRNQYLVPDGLRTVDGLAWLRFIDAQQDITSQLTQQNVIVRPTEQDLIVGGEQVHWHPFECPYLFRGGNNVVFDVVRQIPYSATQLDPVVNIDTITCKIALVGWCYQSDAFPPKGPPSTGFPTGRG